MTQNVTKINNVKDQIKDKFRHGKLIELIDHDFDVYNIDNHTVIRSKSEDQFIDYILMSDVYFYNNWITQFALGEFGGRNYFDLATWSELTDQLTKGVIVVHEETKQFLFLIPKFIEPIYSENAKSIVERICNLAGHAKYQQGQAQAETVQALANRLSYIAENDIPNEGLTGLIPSVIYEYYDIVPKAMKAVIYIRDHYKTITENDDKIIHLTEILKNHFRGKLLSDSDKKFVLSLTNGEFNFEDNQIKVKDNNPLLPLKEEKEEEYDPLVD